MSRKTQLTISVLSPDVSSLAIKFFWAIQAGVFDLEFLRCDIYHCLCYRYRRDHEPYFFLSLSPYRNFIDDISFFNHATCFWKQKMRTFHCPMIHCMKILVSKYRRTAFCTSTAFFPISYMLNLKLDLVIANCHTILLHLSTVWMHFCHRADWLS